jgi:predicted aspartyl protease
MKNRLYALLVLKVAVFYFTLAGVCQKVQAQSDIHFRLAHNALVVVPVMVGKEGPYDFVLDTGANTSIVDPGIAAHLAMVPIDTVPQTTLAGVRTLTRGFLPSLSCGAMHVENVEVVVKDLSELRKFDSHIEGIAGQNFLGHFSYLVNYQKDLIRIERDTEIRDAIGGQRLPLESGENQMLISLEAQSRNHAKLRLLLDSGANSVVLLRAAAKTLELSPQAEEVETTTSGQIGLQFGRLHELVVGPQKFHELAVVLSAAEPSNIGDGLLPTNLFTAFYINNRERFIVLNPRSNGKLSGRHCPIKRYLGIDGFFRQLAG